MTLVIRTCYLVFPLVSAVNGGGSGGGVDGGGGGGMNVHTFDDIKIFKKFLQTRANVLTIFALFNADYFRSFIDAEKAVFVIFYAPWRGKQRL